MVRMLIDLGADARARDDAGRTALTVAATARTDASVIAALERTGVRIDLLAAVSLGRYNLAERLLREDPRRIGPDGPDAIALHLLVAQQDTAGVRWLIDHGVAVSAKRVLWDCNHTALHVAAEHGGVEVTRMLLEAGADPEIRDDKYGATALEWARYCGQPAIAEVLQQRGAPR